MTSATRCAHSAGPGARELVAPDARLTPAAAQFSRFGKIGDLYIPLVRPPAACGRARLRPAACAEAAVRAVARAQDHTTRESRGFAFVRYFDKRDAEVGTSSRGAGGRARLWGGAAEPAPSPQPQPGARRPECRAAALPAVGG